MKFTCTVHIDLPLEKVITLWLNQENNKHWQDGFLSRDLIEGDYEQLGSKYKIILEQAGKRMELIETLLVNNLPDERKSLVEHKHMDNFQIIRFKEVSPNKTQYISEIEYISIKHWIPRLMAKLFPKVFKNQVQKWSNQFKEFAENLI